MQTYNIEGVVRGDTFDGVQFQFIKNGVPINLTAATLRIDFKANSKTGWVTKRIENGNGITIIDAANGIFRIDSFLVELEVGKHFYDIELIIAGVVKTYLGGFFEVIQDVTSRNKNQT